MSVVEQRSRRVRRSSSQHSLTPGSGRRLKPAHLTGATPPTRRRSKTPRWQRVVVRVGILSIGFGVMLGGLSQLWRSQPEPIVVSPTPTVIGSPAALATLLPSLVLTSEQTALQDQLSALNTVPTLTVGALFVDLDQGEYAQIAANDSFPAASTIKVPVLAALLEAIDQKQVRWDDKLVLTAALKAGEAGILQGRPLGSEVSVLEAATLMITISDNMATNVIIDKVGGLAVVNQRFASWGLKQTQLNELLPDVQGTNTTSAQDMVLLMNGIEQGKLLSRRSRDQFFNLLSRTKIQTLLTPGIGTGAQIYHKTGDIGGMVGDVGLIDMANGRRYLATVLVKRDRNNRQANELIRQMSKVVYQYWDQPVSPIPPALESSPAAPVPNLTPVDPATPVPAESSPLTPVPSQG